jgi:hypothetical protein
LVQAKVIHTWQTLKGRQRNELRRLATRAKDAGLRCRCKAILALVQGRTPTMIAQVGLRAKSQVYWVAERFVTEGLSRLADKSEDNGDRKITPAFESELFCLIYVEGERKNSLLFLELRHKLATKTYPKAKWIHIILDNYGIHDRLHVRLALKSEAAQKLERPFLPPYRPDHNRIERIWKDLHDNVTRNRRCMTMKELLTEVRHYLAGRNRRGRHKYARAKAA